MTLFEYIKSLPDHAPEQISALMLSGAAGAYVRAVFALTKPTIEEIGMANTTQAQRGVIPQ